MAYNFIKDVILKEEKKDSDAKAILYNPSYDFSDLDPALSEDTLKYHFKLYGTYVDRFNNNEGDPVFNEAGSFLHRKYFEQFKDYSGANKPVNESLDFINSYFGNFDNFKSEVETVAMGIQGSGWVYLSKNGDIKTIKNHAKRSDIILLIDWWEHAWALDYQHDKKKYLNNIWKIINWEIINQRLTNYA